MMEIAEKYLTSVISNDTGRYGVYHVVLADGRKDMMFQRMSLKDYLAFRVSRWWTDTAPLRFVVALAVVSFASGIVFTLICLAYAAKVGG